MMMIRKKKLKNTKVSNFLQNSMGEMSSKRLVWISTIPFVLVGTIWICKKLIDLDYPELAVDVWNKFYIFSEVVGGFVSAEIIPSILNSLKSKIFKQKNKR